LQKVMSLARCCRFDSGHDKGSSSEKTPDVIIFAHGGPIAMPEDTAYIYEKY